MATINLGAGDDLWEAFQQGLGFEPNTIYGNGGDDLIVSGNMNDFVYGGDGDDLLYGVGGNDYLNGGAGNDILDGGAGTDTLEGGAGHDTYIIDFPATEFGHDVIIDDDGTLTVGYTNFNMNTGEIQIVAYNIAGNPTLVAGTTNQYTLTVTDTLGQAVTYMFEWNGNGTNLVIWSASVPRTQISVTVQNFNSGTFGLNFGPVTPVNQAPVAGDDTANVFAYNSVIINVLANDTDADGTVNATTVTIAGNPAHGTVVVNANGTVTYTPTAGYIGTDSFTYTVLDNEGAVSNTATVNVNVADNTIYLTNNNDSWSVHLVGRGSTVNTIYALDGNDFVSGGSNADTIYGGEGNDTLFGLSGNDTLYGEAGDDILDASSGINTVIGGEGNDTFIVEFTDAGSTTIIDDDGTIFIGSVNQSTQVFSGVTLEGEAQQQPDGTYHLVIGANTYVLEMSGDDLVVKQQGTNPHVVTVQDFVNGTFGITLVTPEPTNVAPVAGDDTANVFAYNSVIINVLANDTDADGTVNATTVTIAGNPAHGTVVVNANGTVTYTPNAGYIGTDSFTYTVLDNEGAVSNTATVNVNVADNTIYLTNNNDSWSVHLVGRGSTVNTIYALDGNDFVSGGSNADTIYGGEGNDTLFGLGGNDTLYGEAGDDILDGAGGNNTVIGGAGNDTYVVEFTDVGSTTIVDDNGTIFIGSVNQSTQVFSGVTLAGEAQQQSAGIYHLVIGANTYVLSWTGGDLTITQQGSFPQTVIVQNFVNGTFGLNLLQPAGEDDINLTNGNDTWSAAEEGLYNSSVVVNALDGDDNIIGGAGNDTINGGEGNDDLRGSWGDDTLNGNAGNDIIRGNWNNDVLNGGAGNDTIFGNWGNDTIYGGAGNDLLYGGWGDDFIFGGEGSDTLYGGFGSDQLTGGAGADIFVFTSHSDSNDEFGIDTILDFAQGSDAIRLYSTIATTFEDLSITQESGNTIVSAVDGTFSVVLTGLHTLTAADFTFGEDVGVAI